MRILDSHTEGEPTRIILDGFPDLGEGSLAERAAKFDAEHGAFMRRVLLEPRGHSAIVGALLLPPSRDGLAASTIYFNPVGTLGMCGHATIGVANALLHMGKIQYGSHLIETPVGDVEALLLDKNTVQVENVESYRLAKNVTVDVPDFGKVQGDIAWGGNWFFLTKDCPIPIRVENIRALTDFTLAIRSALNRAGITGMNEAEIDHIELIDPQATTTDGLQNFVLCPSGDYDRSPCGTGCSAKLACLAADGKLAPGQEYIQKSVIGSSYKLSYQLGANGGVIARVTGRAFVTAQTQLVFSEDDPFAQGILI